LPAAEREKKTKEREVETGSLASSHKLTIIITFLHVARMEFDARH